MCLSLYLILIIVSPSWYLLPGRFLILSPEKQTSSFSGKKRNIFPLRFHEDWQCPHDQGMAEHKLPSYYRISLVSVSPKGPRKANMLHTEMNVSLQMGMSTGTCAWQHTAMPHPPRRHAQSSRFTKADLCPSLPFCTLRYSSAASMSSWPSGLSLVLFPYNPFSFATSVLR